LLTQNRPLNVLKAPEIIIRHLPMASRLAQFSCGPQVSPTSSLRNNLSTSFHPFPTPPNSTRVPISSGPSPPHRTGEHGCLPEEVRLAEPTSQESGEPISVPSPLPPARGSFAPKPSPARQCRAPPLPSSRPPGT